jgi:hypothetical protein
MNYGGADVGSESKYNWTKWFPKFLWFPKKIDGKWYWLRTIHLRFNRATWDIHVQYAVDVFDLMKKDSE